MNKRCFRVVYTHQVCLHYKSPFLRLLKQVHGHDVFGIFGQSHFRQSKYRSIPDIPEINYRLLPTLDLYLPFRKRYAHLFWNPSLGRALQEIRPDVIITGPSNFPNNRSVARFCKRHGVPYVWHGLGSMYSRDSVARRLMNRSVERFVQNAAGGLAFNSASKDYYVEKYGVDPKTILVAPNIVDTDAVCSDRRKFAASVQGLRSQLGLGDAPVVLFVGALDPAKRLDRLLTAFASIKRMGNSDAKLLIVGDGKLAHEMKALCRELQIDDDTLFVGKRIEDVNLYYMLGTIFVMPGLGGLAISHAMAHGLPVITAPADGTEQDLIEDGESGFLLSSDDGVDRVAQLIERLLVDHQLRAKMSTAASQSIENRFNIKNTVKVMDQVIQRVVPS